MLQTLSIWGLSLHCSGVSFRASSVNLYWRRGEGGRGGRGDTGTDWLHCGPLDTAANASQTTFEFETSFKEDIRSQLPVLYGTNFWFCSIKTLFQKWYPVPVDRGFGGGGKQFAMTSQLETIGWDLTFLAFRFYLCRNTTVTKRSIFVNLSDWLWQATK